MIQSALLIALGFVGASFLALLIAPAVWRRAVYLTRKRIESSVPLTVNELQADKDRLRAEHAMALRKIEIKHDRVSEKLAAKESEISRLNERLKTEQAEMQDRSTQLAELQRQMALLQSERQQADADLSNTQLQAETLLADIQTRQGELDSVKRMLAESQKRLVGISERAELATADLEKARAEIAALKESRRDASAKVRAAAGEASDVKNQLKTERAKAKSLEQKLERAVREASDLEAKLARREREFLRQQESRVLQVGDVAEYENRAIAAEQERDELERELAEMTLRLNTLEKQKSAQSDTGSDAVSEVKLAQAQADIKALKKERDKALATVAAASAVGASSANDDALRDQMNQLAAEMVQLTAMLEGEGSPINTLIGEGKDTKDSASDIISLADRVRLLRSQIKSAAE